MRLLFIGNSFTARNDLPGLIARLAATRGVSIEHRLIAAGGASLRTHRNAGVAREVIGEGHYDCVVLQEQSTLPLKNAKRMPENIRLVDEVIRAAGAKTLLYLTWAKQNAPASQQAITDAYTGIGRELGAKVIPVGLAWQSFLLEYAQPVLYDRDGSHPTPAGTYLAARVFLARLLGASPAGVVGDFAGLDETDRTRLQKVAWKVSKAGA